MASTVVITYVVLIRGGEAGRGAKGAPNVLRVRSQGKRKGKRTTNGPWKHAENGTGYSVGVYVRTQVRIAGEQEGKVVAGGSPWKVQGADCQTYNHRNRSQIEINLQDQ